MSSINSLAETRLASLDLADEIEAYRLEGLSWAGSLQHKLGQTDDIGTILLIPGKT